MFYTQRRKIIKPTAVVVEEGGPPIYGYLTEGARNGTSGNSWTISSVAAPSDAELIAISITSNNSAIATSVIWDAAGENVSLTRYQGTADPSTVRRSDIWYADITGKSGTKDFTITLPANWMYCSGWVYYGKNLNSVTPVAGFGDTNTGTPPFNSSSTLNVTTGDIIISVGEMQIDRTGLTMSIEGESANVRSSTVLANSYVACDIQATGDNASLNTTTSWTSSSTNASMTTAQWR